MRMRNLALLLLATALLLSGCRFAAVEMGTVRVEAPVATREAERTVTEN